MLRVIAISFVGVLVVSGQNIKNVPSLPDPDPSFDGVFSTPTPETYPDEYIQPVNVQDEFDWKLSKTVFREIKNQNVIISPLSVKILLTLLAEAAGDTLPSKTRKELEQVLPYNKSLFDAKEYFKKILTSLGMASHEYSVNFGTKVFVDKDVDINQRFGAIATHYYLADVENLDFVRSREAAFTINKWVLEMTKGHIRDLVTENSVANSVVLLINALYFEGTWRFGFNKTLKAPFYTLPNKRVEKDFMEQTGNYFYSFSRKLNAKILRLPYNGRRFSMFIILPVKDNDLDNVINRMDSRTLKDELWYLDETEVHILMPKFKFDSSVNLNEVVRKLGITDIFETNATFPLLARGGKSEGKLKVSNIIQKSGIIVDEKGTTAYAATEIELMNKIEVKTSQFIVDRPFLFYIEDDTNGAKLFCGRVNNPKS